MSAIAIIQARMGSTRLPGKTLLPLAGEPMLARVVNRTRQAKRVEGTVVATTNSPLDEAIVDLCRSRGWIVERGSEEDVLSRYYEAARKHGANPVVRITSDCPLIDPSLVDQAIEAFSQGRWDYASNTLEPRTYPRGLDVEVISFHALERAFREDKDPAWREHVTPYIHRNPGLFALLRLACKEDFSRYRWTVDTREDYELVHRIYDYFRNETFGWLDVLRLLDRHPDWVALNRDVKQKVVP